MTFPTRLLAPGEEVYLDSRPHWSCSFGPRSLTVVVFAGCIAVVVLWPSAPIWMAWVLLGFGLAALVNFLARYLSWSTKSFVVTSQRIVYRTGHRAKNRQGDTDRARPGRDLPPDRRRANRARRAA